ncbi:Endoglucanase precursor [compost metagenome]
MTRLHFAALLVRALGLKSQAAGVVFADQSDIPAWATGEVAAAIGAGILTGYEDNSLRPNQFINRAEMVTMLLRAYKMNSGKPTASTFSDSSEIPEWAQSSVTEAASLGLVDGRENNRFAPNATATRAEALTVLMRMLERK